MNTSSNTDIQNRPLVVDLDFSLLSTDVTYESIILTLKHHPLAALKMPLWYMRGKVYFKQRLIALAQPDAALLPLNASVVRFIEEQRTAGRRVILATASHRSVADAIAAHVKLFDDVIATSDGANLGGANKVQAIRQLIGEQEFDYIGDRGADVPIWHAGRLALAVNPSDALATKLGRPFDIVFREQRARLKDYFKAIRVHQWLKNVLLFLPLLLAHQVLDVHKVIDCVMAFFAFSFCASGVYVLNDLLDLEADRSHPRKRNRPFASGRIPVHHGALLFPSLFIASGIIAANLSLAFCVALALYVVCTSAYSFYLKRIAIVDVLVLAGLYAYRVLCGAVAVSVGISTWMLAFSMFMFLSLAFVKRYSELLVVRDDNMNVSKGRGYRVVDVDLLRSVGTASGYMAVLVMALYINSADVVRLYAHPSRLWLIEPLLLYWITRVWYIANRGEMHDDPVVFALEDRTSYVVAGLSVAVILLATLNVQVFGW